jgi:hypothetical protein
MAATVQWTAEWPRNCDKQWWWQWATAVVTMGDGDCGGTIAMGHNGGGAMDGGMVVQS